MNKKDKRTIISLCLRYLLIIIIGLNLSLILSLLTLPTLYFSQLILSIFSPAVLSGNIIYFNSISIELIPACISISAYFLLCILALSIPNISIVKRLAIIVLSSLLFFIFNVIRICFLSLIYYSTYFDIIHKFLWAFLSTILVVIIWFLLVKLFKIKGIPVYSDIKSLGH
jgi:exosortase/archaeosortase family protein